MGALGQDRGGKPHDRVDRGLRGGGAVLSGLATPDPRLDVARSESAFHLHLQLAESSMVSPEGCAEAMVDRYGELLAGVADQDQALAVLAQPHRGEGLHRCRLLRSAWCERTFTHPVSLRPPSGHARPIVR